MPSATKDKGSARPRSQTAFWDTSAIVPPCCHQTTTAPARRAAQAFPRLIAWWATRVEAASAINRLRREDALTEDGRHQAIMRLVYLHERWSEIQPTDELREAAERLLAVHALRAADAMQLAAALAWCGSRARGRPFVVGDGALALAAAAEGFTVTRVG